MIHKSIVGIQARCSSTRLPRKVLVDLAGRSLIMRVVERMQRCDLVDAVVVLTSDEPSDDELAQHLEQAGVPVRRGSLQDVMARYLALADEFEPDYLVRVTGDCPLVEPHFVDLQLGALSAMDADFVSVKGNHNGAYEGTLGGQMALSARALRRAAASSDDRDREHVGSFFFSTNRQLFRYVEVQMEDEFCWPGLRLAVDQAEDLELARRVFDHFGDSDFSTSEALNWLAEEADTRELNIGVPESQDNQDCRRLAQDHPIQAVGQWP